MRSRLLVGGVAAAAVALAIVAWPGHRRSPVPTGAAPGASPPTAAARTSAGTPTSAAASLRRARPPAHAAPRTAAVTVGGVTIEGAGVYDPDSDDVKANLLEFRKSRLRFALYDAAAECWSGGDDVADLQVAYTLVVERETLRLEDVRMLDSTLPDPALERCIVDRITQLRTPATDIPDLREDGSSWISLHDLYTRNRRGH